MKTRSLRITDWQAELERVALQIAATEQGIEHQRKKIDKLPPDGHAASDAKKQLAMMLAILGMMKDYQASIEWHLSDGPVH